MGIVVVLVGSWREGGVGREEGGGREGGRDAFDIPVFISDLFSHCYQWQMMMMMMQQQPFHDPPLSLTGPPCMLRRQQLLSPPLLRHHHHGHHHHPGTVGPHFSYVCAFSDGCTGTMEWRGLKRSTGEMPIVRVLLLAASLAFPGHLPGVGLRAGGLWN